MAVDISWLFGIGLMIALALFMTVMTYNDTETFFIFLTIFAGFVVWSGLLPLWVLILCIIILALILLNHLKNGGNNI